MHRGYMLRRCSFKWFSSHSKFVVIFHNNVELSFLTPHWTFQQFFSIFLSIFLTMRPPQDPSPFLLLAFKFHKLSSSLMNMDGAPTEAGTVWRGVMALRQSPPLITAPTDSSSGSLRPALALRPYTAWNSAMTSTWVSDQWSAILKVGATKQPGEGVLTVFETQPRIYI